MADISEAKGRQGLYTKQSPQRLKSLKEHALIESAVSSNRIEGVEVEKKRIGTRGVYLRDQEGRFGFL